MVNQYDRVGPKVCIFMKDFLLKMELTEATYGVREWMDFDLRFGPCVDKYKEVYLSFMIQK